LAPSFLLILLSAKIALPFGKRLHGALDDLITVKALLDVLEMDGESLLSLLLC
jgi:hypothetical protein